MIASSILDVKVGGKEDLPGEVGWFLGVDAHFTGGGLVLGYVLRAKNVGRRKQKSDFCLRPPLFLVAT